MGNYDKIRRLYRSLTNNPHQPHHHTETLYDKRPGEREGPEFEDGRRFRVGDKVVYPYYEKAYPTLLDAEVLQSVHNRVLIELEGVSRSYASNQGLDSTIWVTPNSIERKEAIERRRDTFVGCLILVGLVVVGIIALAAIGAALEPEPDPWALTEEQKVIEKELLDNMDPNKDGSFTYTTLGTMNEDQTHVIAKHGYECEQTGKFERMGETGYREYYFDYECKK